jgi:hypothetical protein
MTRIIVVLAAFALLITACGSDEDDFRDQLKAQDPSITDETVDCLIAELDALGLSVDDISADAIGEDPLPRGAQDAMLACVLPGTGEADSNQSDSGATDGTDPTQTDAESSDGDSDSGVAGTYGSDPDLDALWDACEAGDGGACDDLYFQSEIDSEYEEFGDTCGHRFDQSPGYCEEAMG